MEGLAQTCGVITPRQTEGPFFKTEFAASGLRSWKAGEKSRFVLTGTVLTAQCKPVPNALLDFWHADEEGEYDNRGFRYRGHQHADAQGRFASRPSCPPNIPGRARHFHVKVQAPGGRILTTQLYFAGDPATGATASTARSSR